MLFLNDNANVATLVQLQALGVSISMDDFGTGYSSLSYLRSFPIDKIKIDKSFITDIGHNADCAAIIRAITGLGRSLNIPVLAEGVETSQQLEYLDEGGMRAISGLLFQQAASDGANSRVFRLRPVGKPDRRVKGADGACDRLELVDKAVCVAFVVALIRRPAAIPQEGPHAETIAVLADGLGPRFGPANRRQPSTELRANLITESRRAFFPLLATTASQTPTRVIPAAKTP